MGGEEDVPGGSKDEFPIVVIGSGCTGLAIAQGLQKAGIPVIVFEKRAEIFSSDDRDWNMGLHWAYSTLLNLLPSHLHPLIESAHVDPNVPTKPFDTLSFLNGATGEVMVAPHIPNFHRLRRSKLRHLLSQGIDLHFNKTLESIDFPTDASPIAIFSDGTHIPARLIIGADGPRSQVRTLLVGAAEAENTRLPYSATFVQSKFTSSQALFLRSFHPLYIASPHPDGLFAFFGLQDAPKVDEPEGWTFFFYISWASSLETQDEERGRMGDKERLEQVKSKAKGYCEPWKSAFEWVSEETPAWYFDLRVWDPSEVSHEWDTREGKVTLAGDAAHPMTYQRGQGLNHSITDAGMLVTALTSTNPALTQTQAIAAYEKEMIPRAGEEVRISVVNTGMLHDWEKVMQSPVFKGGLNKS